jgi:catechol 2,3-dioxygenase-like lactoylglutathione lyase family enzyme
MIHHVQLACPAGSEPELRSFYVGVLGLTELPKPPVLAARGGCWFAMADGSELHLGVEADFRRRESLPSAHEHGRKAHPGLLWPALDALAQRLSEAGVEVRWAAADEIPGRRRFHTDDPVGNRLEFLDSV